MRKKIWLSRLGFYINYWLAVCLNMIVFQKQKPALKPGAGNGAGGKVLLLYSKQHFDPQDNNPQRKLYNTSAGNLARNIYELFINGGYQVKYYDPNDKITESDADIIFAIANNKTFEVFKKNKQAKKILFLVNSHPLFRARVLLKESRRLKKKLVPGEWVDPLIFIKLKKYTDIFILIGNTFVKNTYLERGVDGQKLYLINSGVNTDILRPDPNKRSGDRVRILFSASHLGIRKGLFTVLEAWSKINKNKTIENLELLIVGGGDPYEQIIKNYSKKFKNINYFGWIDSTEKRYVEILQSSHIVLAPSLEEGQVGCVLEAMATGAVPIISKECGIALQGGQEGLIIDQASNSEEVARKILTLSTDQKILAEMSVSARLLVEKNHRWEDFREKIKEIFEYTQNEGN